MTWTGSSSGSRTWARCAWRWALAKAARPALYQDTLIINRDNEDNSFIIALDKNTGKTLWKKPREERTSWSTPLIIERDGKAQAVVPPPARSAATMSPPARWSGNAAA